MHKCEFHLLSSLQWGEINFNLKYDFLYAYLIYHSPYLFVLGFTSMGSSSSPYSLSTSPPNFRWIKDLEIFSYSETQKNQWNRKTTVKLKLYDLENVKLSALTTSNTYSSIFWIHTKSHNLLFHVNFAFEIGCQYIWRKVLRQLISEKPIGTLPRKLWRSIFDLFKEFEFKLFSDLVRFLRFCF